MAYSGTNRMFLRLTNKTVEIDLTDIILCRSIRSSAF